MPRLVNRKELVRSVDVKILTDLVLHDVLDSSSDEEDEMLCETDGSSSEDDEEIKIAVEAPSMCGEDYYTRKGSYAINAMIVCDDLKRIRHVFAGFPGCSHDHRVFMYSKLALNPFKYFSGHEYLLADSAYPVSDIIVPTFKKPLANSHENTALNTAHSQARVIVEQTIGMLKGRFQSLKALRLRIKNKKDHEFAVYWIRTCCMLHNMLLDDEYDEEWTVEDDGDDGLIPNPNQQAVATERGSTKRERIKQYVLRWQ
ncbi:hypothetical protein RvY_10919 [Ramazzottius varieornatus]|uniref:DDE Tnp4 domain-containing protein n=1 Tax=Ramazzottius varieornatus TaxID=947166 RepID=A0A1D1VGT0_RAMVA|nr:hypothetical protein RvY_10919 [Ramazzottius varieornatus]